MKTNKSYKKRIKVTKKGKILVRIPGQNHFNAKQRGKKRLKKRRMRAITLPNRVIRRFLSGVK